MRVSPFVSVPPVAAHSDSGSVGNRYPFAEKLISVRANGSGGSSLGEKPQGSGR